VTLLGSRIDRINAEANRRQEAVAYKDLLKKNSLLLKQEIGAFLAETGRKRREMSLALKDSLDEAGKKRLQIEADRRLGASIEKESRKNFVNNLHKTERERLRSAGEDALRRAGAVRLIATGAREYLFDFNSRFQEAAGAMHEDLAHYANRLSGLNKERLMKTREYMNNLHKYLLNLLDLDFANKEAAS
jgi:hypothetical protein